MTLKVVSRLWNRFQTSGTVTRIPDQGRSRATTTTQVRYLTLSARRHRQTAATEFSRDLIASSGNRISRQTVYRRLGETALYSRHSVVCALSGNRTREPVYRGAEQTILGYTKNERVLFSVINRDSARKFFLDEFSSRENLGPTIIPPT